MIDVTGEIGMAEEDEIPALARHGFPPGTPVGISGVEQAFNAAARRPAGRHPARGGRQRRLGPDHRQGRTPARGNGEDDDRPRPAGGRRRGARRPGRRDRRARARNGDVRALAGQAFSAPQPPGSTFKMLTTTAALQKGVVSLDDEFEITDGVNVGGRFISNANGEFCGGTFREAFAESCNADFAPLGPKIGNDDFVAAAERFGFNSPPSLYRADSA